MTRNVEPLYSPARRHLSPPTGRRPPAPAAAPTGTAQTGAAPPESRFFSAAAAAGEAALPEESALFQSAQAGASRSPAAPEETTPAAAPGFLFRYRQFSAPASSKGLLHGRPDGRAAASAHVRQRRGRPEFCSADPWTLPFSVAKYAGFHRTG